MKINTIKGIPGCYFSICTVSFLSGCKTDLYSGLAEQDANNMLAIMLNQGISG